MQTFELEGKRILELGCGLGLASLIVHRRGGDITASDCHPLAAAFLLENLKLNRLPAMKYQMGNWSRANPLLERFDLIIGSDILYDRGQPQTLSQFIDLHAQPDVEVLIVDPDRGTGLHSTGTWICWATPIRRHVFPNCLALAVNTRGDCCAT